MKTRISPEQKTVPPANIVARENGGELFLVPRVAGIGEAEAALFSLP